MLRRFLMALVAFMLLAAPASAGRPDAEGRFELDISGYDVTVTLYDVQHVTRSDEMTLGTICFRADGSQILMGNRANPFIYEVNWFGGFMPVTFTVPSDAVECRSALIVADWFKGEVKKVWWLQGWDSFIVPQGV